MLANPVMLFLPLAYNRGDPSSVASLPSYMAAVADGVFQLGDEAFAQMLAAFNGGTVEGGGELSDEFILAARIATLAWQRWRVATASLFLAQACDHVLYRNYGDSALSMSVLCTLGLLTLNEASPFALFFQGDSLRGLVDKALQAQRSFADFTPSAQRVSEAIQILGRLEQSVRGSTYLRQQLEEAMEKASTGKPEMRSVRFPTELLYGVTDGDLFRLALYLLGPDPLESLVLSVLDLPNTYTF
jgi:hypothetical protein